MFEFKLPDVGEGLTEADILEWHVSAGDTVEVNQVLVDIETAKSVVELPSPVAGLVGTVHVTSGETVPVGTVIITIDDGSSGGAVQAEARPEPAEAATDDAADDQEAEKPLILVGTGPAPTVERTRRLSRRQESTRPEPVSPESRRPTPGRAKPPVRLYAKQLGVDLATVMPADGSVISRKDVDAARQATSSTVTRTTGGETRIPVKGVRKATAAAMTRSAFTAPHVTEFLTVDMTRTMDLLTRLRADRAWAGVRLTPLVLVAKALLLTVRAHPEINARWSDSPEEIIQSHSVNLGFAAATPRGLIVPNIKAADTLGLRALADELDDLVTTARAGRTSPEQMAGGTITITNIGALGVDTATPILNPGEAAILAFGNVRETPWVVDHQIVPRMVTQLALSFDHRLIDGELGSNVLATLGRILTDPGETIVVA